MEKTMAKQAAALDAVQMVALLAVADAAWEVVAQLNLGITVRELADALSVLDSVSNQDEDE